MILGGAQENTLITCKLLAERGHDVTLITGPAIGPEGELFNQTKNQKYKVIVVDEMIRAIHPVKDIIAYRKIKNHLRADSAGYCSYSFGKGRYSWAAGGI